MTMIGRAEARMRRQEAARKGKVRLNERDFEILRELAPSIYETEKDWAERWKRPLDIGGSNGSDHSYRLTRLVHAGLADQRQRSGFGSRGSKEYRLNAAGREALANIRIDA